MDNPHELPRPDDPIAQVHAFALDLAWGATQGMWSSGFRIARRASGTGRGEASGKEVWRTLSNNFIYEANLASYLSQKWFTIPPSPDLMQSFGYVEFDPSRIMEGKPSGIGLPPVSSGYIEGQPVYLLTKRAFDLLEKPAIPPKIFISYRQNESSAFASLIEARLTLRDPTIGIFIDKQIEGGAKWLKRIEEEVRQCEHFIIVYGPDTPNSDTIAMEIAWAEETECNIIPVLHHGFTRDCEGYPEQFEELNDITVEKESAKAYENAITDILIALGYSTL